MEGKYNYFEYNYMSHYNSRKIVMDFLCTCVYIVLYTVHILHVLNYVGIYLEQSITCKHKTEWLQSHTFVFGLGR